VVVLEEEESAEKRAEIGEVGAEIDAGVEALRRGEVIAFPTETFYGLGADALDGAALARLLACKGRGAEKGISVLVDESTLSLLVAEVPAAARALMAAHWPGPITIALPARPRLPEALVVEGCVAVRQSPHPVARALVARLGRPITATSANPAGEPAVTTAAAVRAYFGDRCRVVDGGETPGGQASTLVRVRGEVVELLRAGPIVVVPTKA
jgi:L-threonylcarbamoyladenylate synthase